MVGHQKQKTRCYANTRLAATLMVSGLVGVVTPQLANAATTAVSSPAGPRATINSGVIVGTEQGDTVAFLGIPYAAPPVGPLRFKPPQPVTPWTTPLATTAVSQFCTQNRSGVNMGGEDCLYLNVWTQYAPGKKTFPGKRPVMVFIHGGGYQVGSGNYGYYNGQIIEEKGDVVFVTINYRLGTLGFLTSPALDAESPLHISGNYGIEDQQAAIRWVHDNIAAFGGDPANVTLVGQSGGGISVEHAMVSPLVRGLFQHGIIESAIGNQPAATLAVAEANSGATITKDVGCNVAADVAACLRTVPPYGFNLFASPLAAGTPHEVIDGVVLPIQTLDAFQTGKFDHVPVIIGTTHDEYTFAVWPLEEPPNAPVLSAAAYAAQLNAVYGSYGPAVLVQYPVSAYQSPIQALAAAETDSNGPCYNIEKYAALDRYVPIYAYEFNEPKPALGSLQGPPVAGLTYGDVHTADLPYVFGYSETSSTTAPAPEVTGKDVLLSSIFIAYWTNMAKSGDPNVPFGDGTGRYWPDYSSRQLLSLQDTPTLESLSELSISHHCSFWATVPPPPAR